MRKVENPNPQQKSIMIQWWFIMYFWVMILKVHPYIAPLPWLAAYESYRSLLTFAPIFVSPAGCICESRWCFSLRATGSSLGIQFRYRDDITPHKSITSPPSIGMSHPDSQLQISWWNKCRLPWCVFTFHRLASVSSNLFWFTALHLKLTVQLASPLQSLFRIQILVFLWVSPLYLFCLFIILK